MPRLIVLLTAWAWLCPSVTVAYSDGPSIPELIRLAPRVNSGDASYRSIRVSGKINESGFAHLGFLARYQAPDRYALSLTDETDGTPVIYLSDNKLLMYNAVDGDLLYLSRARFDYSLYFEKGRFLQRFLVANSDESSHVLVDVKSLCDREVIGESVVRADRGTVRITRTHDGGNTLVAWVDPSRRCPFQRIELRVGGVNDPYLLIQDLSVNEDVRQSWPAFPHKDRLAGKVKLVDLSRETMFNNLAVSAFMTRSCYARPAIQNKELREMYENRYGVRVDWEKVEEEDHRISRAIREVLRECAFAAE